MRYAEVSVNSPAARRRTFSYAIPQGMEIAVGQAVWVPFGNKLLQGIVLELTPYPAVEETRDILGAIEPRPVLSPANVQLARWISDYYLAPLFESVALMLPPGFERKALTFISASPTATEQEIASLTETEQKIFELVRQKGKVGLKELEKSLSNRKTQSIIAKLAGRGLVSRSYELEPVRVRTKEELYLSLAVSPDKAREEAARLREKRASKQADLLAFLAQQPAPVSWFEARQKVKCTKATADSLSSRGMVAFQRVEVRREPISYSKIQPSYPLNLTADQRAAFEAIKSVLLHASPMNSPQPVFLLHGVTGSGKTEIYLQALTEAVKLGKRGIMLVPEIALTPQTIDRFASRFPRKVAVLHSRLTLGEQFDEWQRIRKGEFDVVIGSRSALFAPQPDLGLITIDEEHEWTYKQQDSPHYHARDVALKLAELTGAVVVLGSATPDVETYYHAQRGDYKLLRLPQRVVPTEGASLPEVEVVDLREELKAGNRSIFSRSLSRSINTALDSGGQVILFLNRRGGAGSVQCRRCGFVMRCRRCEIPLTHHLDVNAMVCHQCHYKMPVPQVCPRCSSRRIKFLGIGTQKVEQEAGQAFPPARLLRWDSDAARGRYSHERIMEKFRSHQADILVGTQMVAKGLDLPLVTVVGVVSADIALNLPDFRAGERTFQLLSQVAGRAGRGALGGRVFIQTYSPDHYAIQAAAGHDYPLFYEQEIAYRRQLQYPPFVQLARLVFSRTNDVLCERETARMKRLLSEEIDSKGIAGIGIIGPAPAYIRRLRGRYRWQLIVRGSELSNFLRDIAFPKGWTIDIDPVGLV